MPERTVISKDGTELAAHCSGSGSPLVMVHGAMGDLDTFLPIERFLAERHTVWVYSRRGRGGSGDGPDYALEREIEDVLAVLEAAGSGAHLFGHSSGAYYCLLAAPRARSLRTLMLYEPPLHADQIERSILGGVADAVQAGDPDRALETFFPVANIVAEEVQAVRAQAPVWEALCRGVLVLPREGEALQRDGGRLLSWDALPEVPTLYLYGELTQSPVYLALDEVRALLPRARLHGLPGQRHLAPMFDPETFARAILAFTGAND